MDFGNPDMVVKNYELEVRTPSKPQWRTVYRVLSDDASIIASSNKQPIHFSYTPPPDTRFYQFRVIVNGIDDNGKYVTGVAGIPTEVFQRNCPSESGGGPITAPPVTSTIASPETSSSSSLSTTTSTTTTTQPPIVVRGFGVRNDADNPGTIFVTWNQPLDLPNDAGLLVEEIGIGDCNPFQTTEGPQIFKLSSSPFQTLRLSRWRQYKISLVCL